MWLSDILRSLCQSANPGGWRGPNRSPAPDRPLSSPRSILPHVDLQLLISTPLVPGKVRTPTEDAMVGSGLLVSPLTRRGLVQAGSAWLASPRLEAGVRTCKDSTSKDQVVSLRRNGWPSSPETRVSNIMVHRIHRRFSVTCPRPSCFHVKSKYF